MPFRLARGGGGPLSTRTQPRRTAAAAVASLIVVGLVSVAPPVPVSAAASGIPAPAGAETFQVSQSAGGSSTEPFLTSDGQRVIFTSTATDLVPGDTNGVADVFESVAAPEPAVPFSGAAARVSLPDGGPGAGQANGPSGEGVANADGRYVVFSSTATNLVAAGGTARRKSVYVRDTLLGRTFRVQGAAEPDGTSYDPDISDDGHLVVFTSDATNLSSGDTNAAPDAFLANLDANGDGVFGDIQLTRFMSELSVPGGTEQARISGNGGEIVFVAHQNALDPRNPATVTSGDFVYRGNIVAVSTFADLIASNSHDPSIDATGDTVAYIDDQVCDGLPAVIAATFDAAYYYAAVGTDSTDPRVGFTADPVISADGSHVAWTTTVPPYDFNAPAVALPEPVIRYEEVLWTDSRTTLACHGQARPYSDIVEGTQASLSASGRTVAYAAAAPAPSSIFAMDTHSNTGLSVSNTQGSLGTPGFMTRIDIGSIPLTSLRGYSAAIANAPIYRLPIYRLPIYRLPIYRLPIYRLLLTNSPIYRLPIYRLPIYRLPIYRLDLPGGWDQVLADTPYAGELVQTVTLDVVLAWAEQTLADASAQEPQRAAALLIQSLTLEDFHLDGSGLDALTLASLVLGNASLAQVPIAGTASTPLERWQALLEGQGIDLTIDDTFALADLDAAGLDIQRSGVDAVPLNTLPAQDTLLSELRMKDLFLAGTPLGAIDASALTLASRDILFGYPATGPISTLPFLPDATPADLAAGAPDSVTVGILLMSMLDAPSYPWEQIAASSFDPNLAEAGTDSTGCDLILRCGQVAIFRYTFDPGPGEATTFAAPTATLTSPDGTSPYLQYLWGSGPDRSILEDRPQSGGARVEGARAEFALPDTAGGTVLAIRAYFTVTTSPGAPKATGTLTSGALTDSDTMTGDAPVPTFDDPDHNLVNGVWQNGDPGVLLDSQITYEWVAPQYRQLNDEGQIIQGPAQDEDYYLVNPPPPGKRLIVSTNATDGQISLSLYSQGAGQSALGVQDAGVVPGTPATEQSGPGGQPAESGADAGVEVPGQTLVDQAVGGGDGTARVEAASMDAAAGQPLLVRVTSGNGRPSAALYSLRVQYLDEPGETACSAYVPAFDTDITATGASDPVTGATNTVYLFDTRRFTQTYGEAATVRVRAALLGLTNTGHVGTGTVQGAVLSVDEDAAVRAARAALDANPCSMQARRTLTAAINAFVSAELGAARSQISSIVIVGGDDIIPLAPVPQHTSQFTETSHAADLRLAAPLAGGSCPATLSGVDPCATPLSAAAAASEILTDDPYGLAQAYQSLGGYLYVPTVALGRLVDGPDQIVRTVDRFVAAGGQLEGSSTLTGGYGAWAELPAEVSAALAWRSAVNRTLGTGPVGGELGSDGVWNAGNLTNGLFPASGASAAVVSVNTHADETRMLPGVLGAESGRFSDSDLLLAAGHEQAPQLAGSLIFGIGCHAGNNLPTAYYGDTTDWVDVFSDAGGYVGNTGYGLANNVTTALGERLLALYADWIGVSVHLAAGDVPVSAAGALTYAKQSYLGGLGLYSGYDEKALMEAVYYGLPMYTFKGATKAAPLPDTPSLTVTTADGLTSAGLSFTPSFETMTATNSAGQTVSYLTANGQAPAAVAGEPVLARILTPLPGVPGDLVPRGAILTALTSAFDDQTHAAIAEPGVGVPETTATRTDLAFPSTFATITRQQTPAGTVHNLVVTPSRVEVGAGGQSRVERFTAFDTRVVYGPAGSTDTTGPVIDALKVPGLGQGEMAITASDPSGVAAVVLLVQRQDETRGVWARAAVKPPVAGGTDPDLWVATVPDVAFRWILQVVDGAGNVTTDTARGHLDVANAPAPTLGDPGPDVTIAAGERLLRAVPVTVAVADAALTASVPLTTARGLTASVQVTAADGGVVTSPAAVETGPDGATTRALIDQTFTRPGHFTVTLAVCRADACTRTSFAVDVPAPNAPPAVHVSLSPSDSPAQPTSTLMAIATPSDPENDPVALAYAWTRNGVSIPDQTAATLALDGIAQPGDVIAVTVTPSDARGTGHAASADLLVRATPTPPPLPTITAVAETSPGVAYAEGTWSTTAVTVTFTCTNSAPLVGVCPAAVPVDQDTISTGREVTGTVTDLLGRSATATVVVKYDGHGPTLDPRVTPATVEVGAPAPTAEARATDASSGVASESCAVPQTTTAGPASVLCEATDVAGNRSTAPANYTVHEPLTACGGVDDRVALAPLNADGSSVFRSSSGVPVVFRACDADGVPIGTRRFVQSTTLVAAAALSPSARVNELWYPPVGAGFSYAKSAQLWTGHIQTLKLASGKEYTYRVLLADGTAFTVTFGVR